MSEKTVFLRVGNKTGPETFSCSWSKIKRQRKWSKKMKDCDQQQRSNTFAQTHLMLLLVVLMAAIRVGAQTSTTGDIAGVVTDPTAAVVSDASITLKNIDTGSSTSTTTNAQGSYNFSLLQPGNYSVSANVAGFQKVLKTVMVTLRSEE